MRIVKLVAAPVVGVILASVALAQGSTLDRALSEAGKSLRNGDLNKTIEILNRADRTRKDPRVKKLLSYAYQSRGMSYFKRQKSDLAYRDYFAANRLTPGKESILQGLGVLTFGLGRKRDAESYMLRVLKINPKNTEALGILGRIAKSRDNTGAASEFFARAAKGAPGREDYERLATKLGKEADVEEKFVTLEKGHFRVQFERGKNVGVEKAVKTVHSYLEQAHRELGMTLGGKPSRRITVVVYNYAQFRRMSSAHDWARAYFDGKIRVALKGWPAGQAELRKDLRHELTHAFLRALYPNTPTWLHEGLAQISEGRSVAAARSAFRTGRYKLLPLETFLGRFTSTKDPKAARVGYAQSLMFVGYLQKLGNRRRMHALLREFRQSTDAGKAVALIYGKSIADLLRAATK